MGTVERFWSKVDKRGPVHPVLGTRCWLWTGATTRLYGITRMLGRKAKAHRVAWQLENGSPGDLCVLHRCDNPPCVNPSHLFIGTQLDNIRDRTAKGRSSQQIVELNRCGANRVLGERNGSARLTEADVRAIRRLVAECVERQTIAERFGVSTRTVWLISSRRRWRHVD